MALIEALAELIENDTGTSYERSSLTLIVNEPLPSSPDKAVRVRLYPGLGPRMTHSIDGPSYMYPRAQVLVRGNPNDATGPETDALSLYFHLSGVKNQVVDGHRIVSLTPVDYPVPLDTDENLRRTYVFNIQVEEGRT